MRKPIAATMLALAGLFLTPSGARAQETNVEEVVAYQMFYQASQAGDAAKALEAAQAYVKQFPEGPNAAYIKQWLAKATAQTRGAQFNQALKEGNSAELIRIGREQLAEKPDDLSYLISLAVNLRKNVLLGAQKNPEWTAAAGEFSAQALKLIEGGAVPPGTDPAKWNKDATLSLLYQNVAIAAQRADKNEDALKAYEKSLALASTAASCARTSTTRRWWPTSPCPRTSARPRRRRPRRRPRSTRSTRRPTRPSSAGRPSWARRRRPTRSVTRVPRWTRRSRRCTPPGTPAPPRVYKH
jgi:tetratricopeptide (TPR) repeat protein